MKKYTQFAHPPSKSSVVECTVLIIDVSPSMECTDWRPNRLRGAIEASEALIDIKVQNHPHDHLGIVAFGGSARVVHGLTRISDGIKSLKVALAGLRTRSATNITAGLECGSSLLSITNPGITASGLVKRILEFVHEEPHPAPPITVTSSNRVILLTDGEHLIGPPPDGDDGIAAQLKKHGVCIDVIGIGGSPKEVNERMLKEIASRNSDGSPRYCFIGDKGELIREFERLAHHLKRA